MSFQLDRFNRPAKIVQPDRTSSQKTSAFSQNQTPGMPLLILCCVLNCFTRLILVVFKKILLAFAQYKTNQDLKTASGIKIQ